MMRQAQLERAEERMQQKWYDLVAAEQRGASPSVLERMFNAYMLAVEEYNRCVGADTLSGEEVISRPHRQQPAA